MSGGHVVIVGAGLAGHRAASALKPTARSDSVTVIGTEEHRPYDRPPLSKGLLSGAMEEERCFLRGDDLDAVDWRLGRTATALDPARRVVTLDDGSGVTYDGLVIATGRRARTLDAADGLAGVHSLRTLADARALQAAVPRASAVAIVGAGFVGCEVAATLRTTTDLPVTVVDTASQPMPVLGPVLGARAVALHEAHGVRFRFGAGVARFDGDDAGRVRGVELEDGTRVDADLVLVAVGSLPNTEWLEGSGLELARGAVVCDEHCFAVGHDDIAIAGDVAAWPHPAVPDVVSIEHWSNAQAMGGIAAANLDAAVAAEREPHAAFPTFWSDQYDVKIQSIGFIGTADRYEVVLDDPEKPALVAEAFAGDRLVGAIAFNRPRAMLQYGRQLREQLQPQEG